MLKIVLLGAGNHSQGNHLPSLARYVSEHPGEVELAALCDLRKEHARTMAAKYGFARVYTDLAEMLDKEQPHGCVAVTPMPVTAEIAAHVMRAGVPLLMEKPPGATVEEARDIVERAEATGARVMVSMNRRFDPALRAALAWREGRPIEYVRASIVRHRRREPTFMYGTGIHPLDAMREIAGDVKDHSVHAREVAGVQWLVIQFTFQTGATGLLEVFPTAGCMAEACEILGPDWRALVRFGFPDAGDAFCWEDRGLVLEHRAAKDTPPFVCNGAYGETVEFISSLKEDRAPHPSPAQVLQSVELCDHISREVSQ